MRYNLSEITDIIKDRRTIYPEFYSGRKIHREILEKLLQSAIWAPTHGQTQPWRFKVFTEDGRQKLAGFLENSYRRWAGDTFQEMKATKLRERPMKSQAVIAVCMARQKSERIPEIEEIEAIAAGVQNLLLTATAYGIGSFWSTPGFLYDREGFDRSFFGLDEKDRCLGLIYLGYPAEEWPKGQRKPIEYVTEWITA